MKRVIAAAVGGLVLGVGLTALAADKFPRHPNLNTAYNDLMNATQHITAAQQANEFDMNGHAANAKNLIAQAVTQLDQAAAAANENAGKRK